MNQAKLADLWLEVSLSIGIVEQNGKNILWLGGQLASLVKIEAKYDFKTYSNIQHHTYLRNRIGTICWHIHQLFVYFFRGLEDDPDGHAEMQLEQALDDNDLVYHDTMITAQ